LRSLILARAPGVLLALLALTAFAGQARAQIGSDRYSSIVIEAASGRVLSAVSADEPRHPASLTKMMTLYMVFEALRDRRIVQDQLVPISAHAASMAPSKLGLLPSSKLTVEQAILGLVTKSANDAASALGELLGGDETRFAQMMTLRARALGMTGTTFRNASGLPDPDQITTARDMALLGRHLAGDFPVYYRYFSTPSFVFRGRVIANHDRMLQTYPGADGIKTGYVEASGHNLVTSAVRGDVRLVGVVMGASTNNERDVHMASLLDAGFERMDVPLSAKPPMAVASARMPSLIQSAQAAQMNLAATPQGKQAITRARAQAAMVQRWAIQIGAFNTETAARQAAIAARRSAEAGDAHVEPVTVKGRTSFRAQVTGLTVNEAQGACAALVKHKTACVVLRPDPGQFASR
jgi:D-alanyl-D-alanine carboxypeptidase